MSIRSVWSLEKGTLRHRVAQQCLISLGSEKDHPDYEQFTDDGKILLHALYLDMIQANITEIRKEENKRLKL